MMLWHWSLPNEILILDPYVFSSAALGNLLFSTLLCNTPISDLLLPQIKYLPISPEILGSSPTDMPVGELPNTSIALPSAGYVTEKRNPPQRWSATAVCVPNDNTFSGQYLHGYLEGTGNQPHNNISPVVACYCWLRTV